MIYILILFGLAIAILVFFMFIILKKTVNKVNEQTKTYFVDKLQVYDGLINEKEERLNEINKQIENNKAKLESDNDNSNKNNYTFDKSIIDLMNKTDYQQENILKLNKKIDNDFDIDFVSIIQSFIDKKEDDQKYNFYKKIKEKFTSKVIYELREEEDIIKAIYKMLNEEESQILKKYLENNTNFKIEEFLNYLEELITNSNPYIEVLVGNKNINYDHLSKYVKTTLAKDIYKGIKIIYKNKVYDYSLNERNV